MLRVFSTFSGISAATIAWKNLSFEFVGYSEIEPFACHVLQHRLGVSRPKYLPDDFSVQKVNLIQQLTTDGIPNFGDITQITDEDLRSLGRVDVLEGGSPCQAFSVAGERAGLADERGNLMLVFCQLAERMRVINNLKYVIWENVKGVLNNDNGTAFGSLLGALTGAGEALRTDSGKWQNSGLSIHENERRCVSWRTLDSQFFEVAQRRERVFVVADFADRFGLSQAILFEQNSEERIAAARRWTGTETVRTASESTERVKLHHPKKVGTLLNSGAGMSRVAGMGSELDFVVVQEFDDELIARRLTALECERLQGFPDDWTAVPYKNKAAADDVFRYMSVGNSMTTQVMEFIGIGLHNYHLHKYFAQYDVPDNFSDDVEY